MLTERKRTGNGIGIGLAFKEYRQTCLSVTLDKNPHGRVGEASLGGFISKYMKENRKGEVMGHSPKEKQTLKLTSEEV